MAASSIVIDIIANMGNFNSGVSSAKTSLKSFTAGVQQAGAALTSVGLRIGAFGAALGAGLIAASDSGRKFQQEMSAVNAISGANVSEFVALTDAAKHLGATTEFSATQAANGMRFLAMAGFDTNEIISAMPGTLALATIGHLDLGKAADIATNILTGFGLAADQTNRVVDVMAATITNSNTDIIQMGEAMKFVAPVAGMLGISVEETAAAIGTLANVGLKASIAGTGLRRAMSILAQMSGETRRKLDAAGVAIEQVDITTLNLTDTLENMQGMSIGEVLDVFGQRAGPIVAVLLQNLNGKFKELKDVTNNAAGAARTMQGIMLNNVQGALIQVQSRLEALRIAFFETFQGTLQTALIAILPHLESLVKWFSDEANTEFIEIMTAIAAGVAVVSVALGALLLVAGVVLTTIAGFAVLAVILAPIAGVLASITGVVALLAVASVALFSALLPHIRQVTALLNGVWLVVKGFFGGIIGGFKAIFMPIWTALAAVMGSFLDFLLIMAGDFENIANWATSLGVVFGALAAVIVGVLAAALAIIIAPFVVITGVILALGRAVGWLLSLLGIDLVESVEEAAQALRDLSEDTVMEGFESLTSGELLARFDEVVGSSRELATSVGAVVSNEQKLNALLEKQASGAALSVKEEQELLKLVGERIDAAKTVEETIKEQNAALNSQIDALKISKQIAMERGESAALPAIEAELVKLNELKEKLADLAKTTTATNDAIANSYGKGADAQRERIKNIQEEKRAQEELMDAVTAAAESREDAEAIMKELRRAKMNDLEREIDLINEKLALDRADIQQQLTAAELEAKRFESLVLQGTVSQEIIDGWEKQKALVEKYYGVLNALDSQASSDSAAARQETFDDQKKLQDRLTHDLLRQSGDKIKLAKFEADQLFAERKKAIEKTHLLESGMTQSQRDNVLISKAKQLADAENIRVATIAAAIEADRATKAKATAKASKSVTVQLQKQVKTMKELLALQQMKRKLLRDAENAMKQAQISQATLQKAMARGVSPTAQGALERIAMMRKAAAEQAFVDAGLDPGMVSQQLQGNAATKAYADNIKKRLEELRKEILVLKDDICRMGGEIGQCFWDSLKAKIEGMIGYVRDAMSRLKHEFDIDTRHSPSMREVLATNVEGVQNAMKNIGKSVGSAKPSLAGVASSKLASVSGGGSPSHVRTLNMNVNNAHDLNELTRRVGMGFNRRRNESM
jgi:TP901 family phage tail tape measure protein